MRNTTALFAAMKSQHLRWANAIIPLVICVCYVCEFFIRAKPVVFARFYALRLISSERIAKSDVYTGKIAELRILHK